MEQDADYERPENKPSPEWPAQGAIEFKDVEMSYRPELPTVLKGLTMNVQGGEKIGIVGRSVLSCLSSYSACAKPVLHFRTSAGKHPS